MPCLALVTASIVFIIPADVPRRSRFEDMFLRNTLAHRKREVLLLYRGTRMQLTKQLWI